jgi:outer membrane protein TolC
MGMPPVDLQARLGLHPIPVAAPEVAVGIPAELLTRRPDVRQAERQAAAQAEQIGIAQADFYPHISVTGYLGYSAVNFSDLFRSSAFNGSVGPQFQWDLLNYGRIAGNVRLQEATLQEKVLIYQQLVLQAATDVENGIIAFLRSQEQAKMLADSVVANEKAVNIVVNQYRVGTVDFNRVATLEQSLLTAQDSQAQARGQIAQGLIQVYRSLGGGWQIRLQEGDQVGLVQPPHAPPGLDKIPIPSIPSLDPAAGENGPMAPHEAPKPPMPDKESWNQPKPMPRLEEPNFAMGNAPFVR